MVGMDETPILFDRDAARAVMREYDYENFANSDQVLDALEECVRPGPPHTIDRGALVQYLRKSIYEWLGGAEVDAAGIADGVLALLRPVDPSTPYALDRDASDGLIGPIEAGEYDAIQWMLWQRRAERAEAALELLRP